MTYKIMQLVSTTASVDYWTFILDTNNSVYFTTDLVVLEAKLKELMTTIPISKLKVITDVSFTDDLIFA